MTSSTHHATSEEDVDGDRDGDTPRTTSGAAGPRSQRVRGRRTRPRWSPGPVVGFLIVAVLAGLGFAAGQQLSSDTAALYSSKAVVRVYNPYRLSGSQFGQVDPVTIVNLERQYAGSKALERAVETRLTRRGVFYDHVVWTSQADAATVTVQCFAAEAVASSTCAQQYADTYVTTRATAISRPLNKQAANLGATLARLDKGVTSLQDRVSADGTQSGSDKNRGLLAQQNTLLGQVEQLTITRQQVQAQADILSGNYQVVTAARTPTTLTTPNTLRNEAVGVGVGFLLGLALYLALSSAGVRRSRPGTGTEV